MDHYEAALRQQLHSSCDLIVLDTVDSTNLYAKKLASQGAAHGTVVIADCQTAGRGRLGRSFASPKGLGLYCSVILRLNLPTEQLMNLTVFTAEAARRAFLEAFGVETGIKWINDLVFERKKLCGILTELGFSSQGTPDYAIVGIGINCNHLPSDFPEEVALMATSLRQILGRPVDRSVLAGALIRQLTLAAEAMAHEPASWLNSYRTHCVTIGQDVQLVQNGQIRSAHVIEMDDQGALLVVLPDGTPEKVFSGEVSVRGMYGYQ